MSAPFQSLLANVRANGPAAKVRGTQPWRMFCVFPSHTVEFGMVWDGILDGLIPCCLFISNPCFCYLWDSEMRSCFKIQFLVDYSTVAPMVQWKRSTYLMYDNVSIHNSLLNGQVFHETLLSSYMQTQKAHLKLLNHFWILHNLDSSQLILMDIPNTWHILVLHQRREISWYMSSTYLFHQPGKKWSPPIYIKHLCRGVASAELTYRSMHILAKDNDINECTSHIFVATWFCWYLPGTPNNQF